MYPFPTKKQSLRKRYVHKTAWKKEYGDGERKRISCDEDPARDNHQAPKVADSVASIDTQGGDQDPERATVGSETSPPETTLAA